MRQQTGVDDLEKKVTALATTEQKDQQEILTIVHSELARKKFTQEQWLLINQNINQLKQRIAGNQPAMQIMDNLQQRLQLDNTSVDTPDTAPPPPGPDRTGEPTPTGLVPEQATASSTAATTEQPKTFQEAIENSFKDVQKDFQEGGTLKKTGYVAGGILGFGIAHVLWEKIAGNPRSGKEGWLRKTGKWLLSIGAAVGGKKRWGRKGDSHQIWGGWATEAANKVNRSSWGRKGEEKVTATKYGEAGQLRRQTRSIGPLGTPTVS
jgi:hypothetical protein